MKSLSYMIRILFLCFLSICSVSCSLSAMMPGSFSEEAWDDFCTEGKYKKLWGAHANLEGKEHLERASDWRVKRINEFFELTVILSELRHWSKNGHLEDSAAKDQRVAWLLKIWMIGFFRIIMDESARSESTTYSSILDLWKFYYGKYLSKDITDSFWISAYGEAKDEVFQKIDKDRYTIEGNDYALVEKSALPNFEAVLMLKEESVLWGFRGKTFTFVRTQEEAVKFFPSKLKVLHEKRVLALNDALESLKSFRES